MKPHMYLLNKDWEPTIVYPELMKEGREKDYKTLSGTSLTGEAKEIPVVETIEKVSSADIDKAHDDYKAIFGKNVPPNKKNDLERITAKVNETLTPAN